MGNRFYHLGQSGRGCNQPRPIFIGESQKGTIHIARKTFVAMFHDGYQNQLVNSS